MLALLVVLLYMLLGVLPLLAVCMESVESEAKLGLGSRMPPIVLVLLLVLLVLVAGKLLYASLL
jgi:hypothetical protein